MPKNVIAGPSGFAVAVGVGLAVLVAVGHAHVWVDVAIAVAVPLGATVGVAVVRGVVAIVGVDDAGAGCDGVGVRLLATVAVGVVPCFLV